MLRDYYNRKIIDASTEKELKYKLSLLFTIVRRIKYTLFVLTILTWCIGFNILGFSVRGLPSTISNRTSLYFILVGWSPFVLLSIYVLVRIIQKGGRIGWDIFKCN